MNAFRQLGGRVAVGHPVDVASGAMFRSTEDFRVPGRMPLSFTRHYNTAMLNQRPGVLGPGWTHEYALTLTQKKEGYYFRGRGGTEILFEVSLDRLDQGLPVRALGSYAELSWENGLLAVTVWFPDTHDAERFIFTPPTLDTTSLARSIEATMGRAVDFRYDNHGRLALASQRREGRSFSFRYDGDRLASVLFVSAAGNTRPLLRFTYDGRGRLEAAYDPLANVEYFTYDEQSRMLRETNRSGGTFDFAYDHDGRCVHTEGVGGYDRRAFRYVPTIGWTEATDSVGGVWGFTWAGTGQVLRTVTPSGATYATEYDGFQRIVADVDARGRRTTYEYDDAGNRSAIVDALGQTTRYLYNTARQLVQRTDAAGGEWRLEYDERHYLRAATDPLGSRWTYELNDFGEVERILNPLGGEMRYRYGSRGEHLETVDWEGNVARFRQNEVGWLDAVTDPRGATTYYHYDALLRPIMVVWPNQTLRRFTYDAWDNVTAIVEPDESQTRYRYGTCGRLEEAIDALGRAVRFRWGTEQGQLKEIINEKGEIYRFEYDEDGRPVTEVDFGGRRRTTAYDANGFYVRQTNGAGEETIFEVDAIGQLLKKHLPDGASVTFSYDALGRIRTAENDSCRVTFERDALGRVLRETRGQFVIESRYDALGNRIARSSSLGHSVDFGYDRNGRLSSLQLEDHRTIEFQRDRLGQEILRRLPNGLVMRQEYDSMGCLRLQVVGGANGSNLIHRSYRFDNANRVVELDDRRYGLESYQYSMVGELVAATIPEVGAEAFRFDQTGNLVRATRSGGGATRRRALEEIDLKYSAGDTLKQRDASMYESDGDGRPVQVSQDQGRQAVWEYGWDGEGWLATVRRQQGTEVKYQYDPFGRRIRKDDGLTVTEFIWDGDLICHELRQGMPAVTWAFHPDDFTPLIKQSGPASHCRSQCGRLPHNVPRPVAR
jgi:YD repeat-containing protein